MIYVITHKDFDDSILDCNYKVLHVGSSKCSMECLRDDTLENISYKNANFCELTGLYWIWKNSKNADNDITGLVHYRRFFTTPFENWKYAYLNKMPSVLSYDIIEDNLKRYEIILSTPIKIIRTVKQFYNNMHISEDLDLTREVIAELDPDYLPDFDKVMMAHRFYYGNMMICRGAILNEYSEWLFDILFTLEKKIDLNKYDNAYQKRVFGFISERLLQVWVVHNNLKIKWFPVYNTEKRQMTFFAVNKRRLNNILKRIKGLK